MRRIKISLLLVYLVTSGSNLSAQTAASFRILFGGTDQYLRGANDPAEIRWDGSLKVRNAGQYNLEPWRFRDSDNIEGDQFHFSTRAGNFVNGQAGSLMLANGFILTASAVDDRSEFAFSTAQGDFSFRASEVPYGKGIYKLGGRVYVDRVPVTIRLTETPEEEDYPALAAGPNGDIWSAYVQFHHSPDADKLRAELFQAPRDFNQYAEPTGGDQIWTRKYSHGMWEESIPVTSAGKDCYRAAVALDGNGRTWVIWSQNDGGNFDIWARPVEGSEAGQPVSISNEAGADIDPVAATDASGRVWIAWQGWRNGVAAIYAVHQEGRGFSKSVKVSNSNLNEWNPAIAADKSGRVAVAWDSYRRGNYDVYARIYSTNTWGDEIPVAATARYEAYPSIAFDGTGRLWIAYEEGGKHWGKDFGAYETTGISLYQGRLIKMRALEPNGSFVDLNASLDSALVGPPNPRADRLGSQADSGSLDPDPTKASHRAPDTTFFNFPGLARNTLPRLVVDGSERFWLAFRTPHPTWEGPIGPSWEEYLVSFDGKGWTRPIFLDHTDNLLDNKPALALLANGKLLMVNSSDGRRLSLLSNSANVACPNAPCRQPQFATDPNNNDLWSRVIDLGPGTQAIPVVASQVEVAPAALEPDRSAVLEAIHQYRGGPQKDLRIARGDFHRHSEIDVDGRNDGTLFDQWRYIRDAGGLDWVGCCSHDNGWGREYSWWIIQKLTDVFYVPGQFASMFSYERSVAYPEGHRNVVFVQRGIRPLPRLFPSMAWGWNTMEYAPNENVYGHAADTRMLYAYLRQFHGIVGSHTSATDQGTDWRDNDPELEPVVEIYQGLRQSYEMPGGPRATSVGDSPLGGWRPKGFINRALEKGYRLGFESSSDHVSTHISFANLYVTDLTREAVLDALKKRHVYASTDEILADVESGTHMMGDEFSTAEKPTLRIKLRGTSRFVKVSIIRDGKFVYSASPNKPDVELSWRDNQPNKDKTSYYYVRGEQDNGEVVWVSPLWIKYTGE